MVDRSIWAIFALIFMGLAGTKDAKAQDHGMVARIGAIETQMKAQADRIAHLETNLQDRTNLLNAARGGLEAAVKEIRQLHAAVGRLDGTLARSGVGCDARNFTAVGHRTVQGRPVYVRRFATVLDGAINDYGPSAGGDHLEVFCVLENEHEQFGSIGICLSRERCAWR